MAWLPQIGYRGGTQCCWLQSAGTPVRTMLAPQRPRQEVQRILLHEEQRQRLHALHRAEHLRERLRSRRGRERRSERVGEGISPGIACSMPAGSMCDFGPEHCCTNLRADLDRGDGRAVLRVFRNFKR